MAITGSARVTLLAFPVRIRGLQIQPSGNIIQIRDVTENSQGRRIREVVVFLAFLSSNVSTQSSEGLFHADASTTDESSSPASSVDRIPRPSDIRASARLRAGLNAPRARCARS